MLSLTLDRLSQKVFLEQPCFFRTKQDLRLLQSSVNNPVFLWPAAFWAVHAGTTAGALPAVSIPTCISRPRPAAPLQCRWQEGVNLSAVLCCCQLREEWASCAWWGAPLCRFGRLLALLAQDTPAPAQLGSAACLWTQSWRAGNAPGEWYLTVMFYQTFLYFMEYRGYLFPSLSHWSSVSFLAPVLTHSATSLGWSATGPHTGLWGSFSWGPLGWLPSALGWIWQDYKCLLSTNRSNHKAKIKMDRYSFREFINLKGFGFLFKQAAGFWFHTLAFLPGVLFPDSHSTKLLCDIEDDFQ